MGLSAQPKAGILKYLNHFGLLVHRVGLVSGPEIKDFAFTDVPYHATAKLLAFGPCFLENDFIGLRDVKRLVVHFCSWNLNGWWQAFADRVIW